ncbi:hypothetical protein CDD81_362 [Ophiocordyceps australis]|uniref:Cytochrome P450 n=1 Tax=Ophiocordyceps australis TaxID=1399860 RepID=A0A2C5Y3B9_9HYPO|nr:hypothetical protein CDD81_362 [Ophiocordyceps australis]
MTWWTVTAGALALYIVILGPLYNIFLHPLRKFPGPLLNRATTLPVIWHVLRGTLPIHVGELHARYGKTIRLKPNELSLTHAEAWKAIYGDAKNEPDQRHYNFAISEHSVLLGSPQSFHTPTRRLLRSSFNQQAVQSYQHTIKNRAMYLVHKLDELSSGNKAVDVNRWLDLCVVDMLASLIFRADWKCMQSNSMHPAMQKVHRHIAIMEKWLVVLNLGLDRLLIQVIRVLGLAKGEMRKNEEFVESMLKDGAKLASEGLGPFGEQKHDLIQGLVHGGFSLPLVANQTGLLLVAGGDATPSLLAAIVFFISSHPAVFAKLALEIRSRFRRAVEIDMQAVNGLPYLNAVIQEAGRCIPPVIGPMPRVVAPGGVTVAQDFIPQDTRCLVWHYAMFRSADAFADPLVFDPERFYSPGQGVYAQDRMEAYKPFSLGPRACMGVHLAMPLIRIVVACLVLHFNMGVCPESADWPCRLRTGTFWGRGPLHVNLTRAPVWSN